MNSERIETIMVVDDNEVFRTRLVAALKRRGYKSIGAADAPQALEAADRGQIDRAIIDLRMPGPSGLDLIGQLGERHPNIETVVLTGYGSIATALEATRMGATNYLTKPADADQILAAFDPVVAPGGTLPAAEITTPSLARVEWEHIQRVLADCGGNVSQAARVLGIHRRSLQRKLAKYPLPR